MRRSPPTALGLLVLVLVGLGLWALWPGSEHAPGPPPRVTAVGPVAPAGAHEVTTVEVGSVVGGRAERTAVESASTAVAPGTAPSIAVPPAAEDGFRLTARVELESPAAVPAPLDGVLGFRARPTPDGGAFEPFELEAPIVGGRLTLALEGLAGVEAVTVFALRGSLGGEPVVADGVPRLLERGRPQDAGVLRLRAAELRSLVVVGEDGGAPLDGVVVTRGRGGFVLEALHPGLEFEPFAGPGPSPLPLPAEPAASIEARGTHGFLVGARDHAWKWVAELGPTPDGPRVVELARAGALRVQVTDPLGRGEPLFLHVHPDPGFAGTPLVQHAFVGPLEATFHGLPAGTYRVAIGGRERWRRTPRLDSVDVQVVADGLAEVALRVPSTPAVERFEVLLVLRSQGWEVDALEPRLDVLEAEAPPSNAGPIFPERLELDGGRIELRSAPLELATGRYALVDWRHGARVEFEVHGPGEVALEVGAPARARVTLVDAEDDAPLADALLDRVLVFSAPVGGRVQQLAQPLQAGREGFLIAAAAGPVELRVTLERAPTAEGTALWPEGSVLRREVTLPPGESTLELALHRGHTVRVELVGDEGPFDLARLEALRAGLELTGPGAVIGRSSSGSRAVLRVDRPGEYLLHVTPPDGYTAPTPTRLTVVDREATDVTVRLERRP